MRPCLTAVVCAALALWLLAPAPRATRVAHAQDYWDVIVGGDDPATGVVTYGFWPATLTIHTGDTVRWSFFSLFERHTVSFLRDDPPPPVYLPGAGAGELRLGPAWFPIGTIVALGTFDNTQDLSSGASFGAEPPLYSLSFTTAGVFNYQCLLHPGMTGVVTVLDDGTLPERPADALARGETEQQRQIDTLSSSLTARAAAGGTPPGTAVPAGATGAAVAPVEIGASDPGGVSALSFFPRDVSVRRGDTVLWTSTDAYATHTVTFTSGAPPPDAPVARGSGPAQLVLTAEVAGAAGGNSYSGAGYVNSGLLAPGGTFALTFDAPPGVYRYQCLLHPSLMHGTVTVTGEP